MDSQENGYKGLKCREIMQFLNESKHTPFAILHLPSNKKLLMIVSDKDTHCTMRVATKADLPASRQLQAPEQELHGDAKLVVVCDVYPHRDTAGVDGYEVVPRIRPKIAKNHIGNFSQAQNEQPKTSGNQQKQRKMLPKDQNGTEPSFGTVANLLQNTSNPFCDELERIVSLL